MDKKFCLTCGKELERKIYQGKPESNTNFKIRNYCNRSCGAIAGLKKRYHVERISGEKQPTAQALNSCVICGQEIVVTRYNGKFCSNSCKAYMSIPENRKPVTGSGKNSFTNRKHFFAFIENLERNGYRFLGDTDEKRPIPRESDFYGVEYIKTIGGEKMYFVCQSRQVYKTYTNRSSMM